MKLIHIFEFCNSPLLFISSKSTPSEVATSSAQGSTATPIASTITPTASTITPTASTPNLCPMAIDEDDPSSAIAMTTEKRFRVQSNLHGFVSRPISINRQKDLNKSLINMITTDLQPFSIVDDKGFKKFVSDLNSNYVLPSRTTLTRQLLPQAYECRLEEVKAEVSTAEYIALTTDTWTSRATESYIAITAHFIDNNFILQSYLLDCCKFSENHTAENLRNQLLVLTKEWNIEKKICAVVTDNAANIKAAVRMTGWNHFSCFAHSLNLVVQSSVKNINNIQVKVKAIVEYFHRSTVASEKLNKLQQQMNSNPIPLKLKMDVITRWNSIYHMFQRLCDLQEPVEAAIGILNGPVSRQQTNGCFYDTL